LIAAGSNSMWYSLFADLVLAVHVAYVVYIVAGLALILVGLWRGWGWVRNPWFRLTHLAAIAVVALGLIFQTACPLTVWEMELRSLAGQPVSEATFVGRLLHHLLFGAVPTWASNAMYVLFSLAIAAAFVVAPPRRGRRRRAA
jgi:Protein of Unknown function (DUF2784)